MYIATAGTIKKARLLPLAALIFSAGISISTVEASPAKNKSPQNPSTMPVQKAGINAIKSLQLNEQGVASVQRSEFKKAEGQFKQAVDIDERNLTAVFNLAGMYLTNKKEDDAITLLEEYINKYPKDAGLYARLGDAYFASKKLDPAAKNYEQSLKMDPTLAGVPGKLGTLYGLSNKLVDAEKMYVLAAKQTPKDPQVLSNLSSLLLTNGKPKDAVQAAKAALQLRPTAEAYVTLGNAYSQLRDKQNALIAFQRAKELGSKETALDTTIANLQESEK